MNQKQISLCRWLISKAGLENQKNDLAWSFSSQRTEHLSELTYPETQGLVKYLRAYTGIPEDNSADKQRRKILSMAHEMHWERPGSTRIDMERVDNWCIRYSGINKPLDAFALLELPALVTQFKMVYMDFLKGI